MRSVSTLVVAACLYLAAVPVRAQGTEDVDEFADLSGLVLADPATNQGTLYTTPAEELDVLAAFEAIPVGTDRYEIELEDAPVQFGVVLTPLPALYLPADDVAAKPKEGKSFRNAQCKLITPGITSGCFSFNFQSAILQTQPVHRCKHPGPGHCVEKKKVVWTRFIFSDPLCAHLIALNSKRGPSCQ